MNTDFKLGGILCFPGWVWDVFGVCRCMQAHVCIRICVLFVVCVTVCLWYIGYMGATLGTCRCTNFLQGVCFLCVFSMYSIICSV